MKLKTKTQVVLLMVILVAFALITCVDQDVKVLRTDTLLLSLSVESGNIIDTATSIAVPIPASVMEKDEIMGSDLYGLDYDQPGTDIGWLDIRLRDKDTGKITGRVRTEVSAGAQSRWGIGTRTTRPDIYYDTRVPVSLDDAEYIYIRVEAEDGKNIGYYRFYAKLMSWTTNLQYININEREGKAGASITGESTGGSVWNAPTIKVCELSIGLREGQNALIVPTTFDPNATVSYAVSRNATSAPQNFTPSDQRINIADQNYLYVEVTAPNTIDKEYFKFKVSVGRITTIKSFKVNDGKTGSKDIEVFGLGLPQKDWTKVGFGEYQTADQPKPDGFILKLVMDDPDATFQYERIADKNATEPASYTTPNKIYFTNPQALAVKIKAPNDPEPMYYKIYITNLAANITAHPKSAWYYRDDVKGDGIHADGKKPVVALSVTLDRAAVGNYEYQWYESDSWYGIYGRHGTSVDEKNNITTVNGGPGQYFYLVQGDEPAITLEPTGYTSADWIKSPGAWQGGPTPGKYYWVDYSRGGEPMAWSLPGETGSTYMPRTDWVDDSANMTYIGAATQNNSFPVKPLEPKVNFLSGATNESRYYWVKITDTGTGLSVVSERALILTETNPKMDHFIFDLSILPKKNIIPFTKNGTAMDNVYKINLKNYPFPADFEKRVADYQICIAHAQYFLMDGRPWTQNWTHGNLHFGLDDGSLTWWHNNMGANGGSIPLQAPHSSLGGLSVKPQWIGFTPSGDPAKGLPPPINAEGDLPKGIYSMEATEKYPAGVAQGYFAAFIELLEVRFSTAPPK
jgi:hypothetical protein